MAIIRVNPNTLKQSSGSVTQVGSGVKKLGDEVWRSASSAPSYQGQFGPKVRAIGQAARSNAQKHTSRMIDLGSSLSKRAAAFLKADSNDVGKLRIDTNLKLLSNPAYLKLIAAMMGINSLQLLLLIQLGKLRIPIGKFPWTIIPPKNPWSIIKPKPKPIPLQPPKPKTPVKPDDKDDGKDKGSDTKTGKSTTEKLKLLSYDGKKDCYAYVKFQREGNGKTIPTGMCGKAGQGLYSGEYTGSGTFTDSSKKKYTYGQEPVLGAIMVESPAHSSQRGVTHGHVSIVSEVTKDSSGKVVSFKISEQNWPNGNKDFTWNSNTNRYENPSGRFYDCFVY